MARTLPQMSQHVKGNRQYCWRATCLPISGTQDGTRGGTQNVTHREVSHVLQPSLHVVLSNSSGAVCRAESGQHIIQAACNRSSSQELSHAAY